MTEAEKSRADLWLWLPVIGVSAALVGYAVLIVLVFVVPEVPMYAGLIMILPALIYLAWNRGSKKEFGTGCLISGVLFIAGLALLGLGAAFQPEVLESVMSALSE